LIWGGAAIVTMNGKILGGKISFLQSVCVLGYCIFPINLAAIAITVLKSILDIFILKLALASAAFVWSSYSSMGFMSALVMEDRKELAVYPIFLFYMFLSFFCLFI
jgi:protein YIPF6